MTALIPIQIIENKIFVIRGHKIMIDRDLAELYETETFRLNEAVKRNIERFPSGFMFQLTKEEWESLTSQFAISKIGRGGRRTLPYVFTEHGVLMIANVLNSKKAVAVSIQIVQIFVKLRQIAIAPVQEINELKKLLFLYMEVNDHKQQEHDEKINDIIMALNHLMEKPQEIKQIGFKIEN